MKLGLNRIESNCARNCFCWKWLAGRGLRSSIGISSRNLQGKAFEISRFEISNWGRLATGAREGTRRWQARFVLCSWTWRSLSSLGKGEVPRRAERSGSRPNGRLRQLVGSGVLFGRTLLRTILTPPCGVMSGLTLASSGGDVNSERWTLTLLHFVIMLIRDYKIKTSL